jgi:phosphomannomutase
MGESLDVVAAARAWVEQDPDPRTRALVHDLIERDDRAALSVMFGGRLAFGTAGMRGPIGAGPLAMSRLTVLRVTTALAEHLCGDCPDVVDRGVVIGFDGRRMSREFAADAAAVLAAHGIPVWSWDDVVPTPELAFAVTHLGAAAGIMVTASHNPPADNGYKVYAGNGAQIVPPHDAAIEARLDALGRIDAPMPVEWMPVPRSAHAAWMEAIAALRVHTSGSARLVYTAMHGVGRAAVEEAMRVAGHTLHLVTAQADPDPDFPTVKFPNPEEPGALDLALALAREVDADAILANDPDADRLAVAVRVGPGDYQVLTGNQVGVLLADDLLASGGGGPSALVATTIVSTALLARVAASYGATYAETLTGFKWIANKAIDWDRGGGRFVVGFEEALGYSAGSVVRDKDGVSAAVLVADLVAYERARGRTLVDRLEDLARAHGVHTTGQRSRTLAGADGAARIAAVMEGLRASPPAEVAGVAVVAVRDVRAGTAHDLRSGVVTRLDLPSSDGLAFDLADGSRVLVRPSGTEPKIKLYFEARVPVGDGESVAEAEQRGQRRVAAMADDLLTRTGL